MTWLARPRRIAPLALLLALTVRGAASPPQILPTNGAPDGPRTGMIAGQVVDASGAPVPEEIVRLAMPRYLETLPTTPKGRVMADGEGRYFFADLPAGDYYLQASKDGYASGTLPAGEYFLAALTDLEAGEWNDPALLEQLVGSSVRVTLREGTTTTQDIRIGGGA